MTSAEIQKLLSLGEGQRIEFKTHATHLESLGRVICGFLNTAGGYLICGVDERGPVPGVNLTPGALAALERTLHDAISPKALVSFQIEALNGTPVLVIEVPSGQDVPYAFQDTIYLRAGERTEKADAATIRDIVMRRQVEPERWERRFAFAELESDIAPGEVRAAVADAQKVRRAFFRDATRPLMVLEDFSAAKYGRLTNGGDVLFAKNPAARLPQTRVRAMRYNSDKAGDKFSDMKSFEGPLKSVFEEAYSFIVRNTPSVSRFVPGNPQRQDSPLYPEEAVREALINALAHRDYAAASGGVAIHVFPRRLEIWNSGALPEGVTEDNLPKGHISVLRNPDIAHALYLRGLMEKAGRGSVLMVQQCRDAGLPDPFWKSDPKLGVTVTLPAPDVTPDVTPEVPRQDSNQDKNLPRNTLSPIQRLANPEVTPDVTPEVTPEVRQLLRRLHGEMLRRDLQSSMKLKDAEHFRKAYLVPALEADLVEMTIPDKPKSSKQRYRLTALGRAVLQQHNA